MNRCIRRIHADIREIRHSETAHYTAHPSEEDMRKWFFTIRGPRDTCFFGGEYHGVILLSADYPYKPPNIMWLTPNGRFEVRKKICLSISAHHPEHWMPAWGIRTIVEALISFMPTPGNGAIGALDWNEDERKRLAESSHTFDAKLPDDYLSHLKIWREKFPRLEENDDSLKLNQDTAKQFHFHDTQSSSSSSSSSISSSSSSSKSNETKEEKMSESEKKDEKEEPTELRRRQGRTNGEQEVITTTTTTTRRRVQKKRPNHIAECLGFLVIAIIVGIVLFLGRRYLRL